jgi:hypothetical protein
VIVACGGDDSLTQCLARLDDSCRSIEAEVVVVHQDDDSTASILARSYPDARFVAAPADLSTAELRALGMNECSGDIVAITRDCDERGPDWLEIFMRRARTDATYGPHASNEVNWQQLLRAKESNGTNGKSNGKST